MKEETVTIHGAGWQLAQIAEEVTWCQEQSWTLARYTKPDDHAHCAICWWTIGVSDDDDVGLAYTTGRIQWLCRECFGKFIQPGLTSRSTGDGAKEAPRR
jgi:hypothetical protein